MRYRDELNLGLGAVGGSILTYFWNKKNTSQRINAIHEDSQTIRHQVNRLENKMDSLEGVQREFRASMDAFGEILNHHRTTPR